MEILTDNELMKRTPSVFASSKWHERTRKYKFVPTTKIINSLRDNGYFPSSATQSNSRIKGKASFTKHVIRFRHYSNSEIKSVGDLIPEIGLTNSHDGTSSVCLFFGIFRAICTNGLVVADSTIGGIRLQHRGNSNLCKQVIKSANRLIEKAPIAMEKVNDWQSVILNDQQKIDYAKEALNLNPSTIEIKPERLLTARRYHDRNSSDLWTTFNNVQENMIKGGLIGRNSEGRFRHTRKIKSIDNDLNINRGLWALTEKFAKGLKYIEPVSDFARLQRLIAKYGRNYIHHLSEAGL